MTLYRRRTRSSGGGLGIRLIIGAVIAIFSLVSYLGSQQYNPVVGENQHVSMTTSQEIALGLQSVLAITQEYGGTYPDAELQGLIDTIGAQLVNNSVARDTPWRFEFTVLDDSGTVNAFALPGGPVFMTTGLLSRLETEDEIAGVLAHEIVHVLARHSAQQLAKNDLTNGLIGAVGVASGSADAAQTAAVIGQLVNMRYGREDELQSDTFGVCLMIAANYDPNAMVAVMQVLESAGGGGGQSDFFSTHPSPQNRISQIEQAIQNADSNCPA